MKRFFRLLRIIYLIQTYPGIKAKELAAYCETSERTIYRDLNILSEAHVPIFNEGKNKGYRFTGNFKLYPMDWTEEEYSAFKMLPILLADKMQTKAFQTAYEKVMAAHTAVRIDRKQAVSAISKVIKNEQFTDQVKENDFLSLISEAVLSKRTIEAVYHTQSWNVITKRKIDPYFLIPRNNRLYVIGYCHLKKEVRTFRLNRFRDIRILDVAFTMDNIHLKEYLQYTWSVIRGDKRIHFKVRFSNAVARYIKEEDFNVEPRMTDLPDGGLLFEVTLNDDFEFMQWLMQYGSDAEILEPVEYRNQIKETLEQWIKVYQ